jgi:hypothetical protein
MANRLTKNTVAEVHRFSDASRRIEAALSFETRPAAAPQSLAEKEVSDFSPL